MGRVTTLEERILINELADAGYTDPEIAELLALSRWTVRKWRRRGRQGRQALASKMGRPVTGVLSTFPSSVRETLQTWRDAHPGWGPKTLRTELEGLSACPAQAGDERFEGQPLPEKRSIARFLEAEELARPYERHSELPQSARAAPQAPHEEWEMDARGQEQVPGVGLITLINLNDRCSRTRLLSYPCQLGVQHLERRPTTEDYQLALRLAFTQWGLPDRLAVDHDSVFYDNSSKSPFPTRFHLWLVALGISLVFGRIGCATDQGVTERSHQLWAQQVLLGQSFSGWEALFLALCQRQDFLNTRLPCATLGEVPPLVAHPEACSPRRLYRPEWETELLDLSRVYAYLAQGRWFRLVSSVGTVSLGSQIYVLGRSPWARQQVEITFDASDQQVIFHAEDGETAKRLPLKGLTVETLMGEMGPLVNLPAFQLALPFSWDEWRAVRLCDTLGV